MDDPAPRCPATPRPGGGDCLRRRRKWLPSPAPRPVSTFTTKYATTYSYDGITVEASTVGFYATVYLFYAIFRPEASNVFV
jgi:hypothetical protein